MRVCRPTGGTESPVAGLEGGACGALGTFHGGVSQFVPSALAYVSPCRAPAHQLDAAAVADHG
jgi:hypothetical protein